jgi:hypothetical protein
MYKKSVGMEAQRHTDFIFSMIPNPDAVTSIVAVHRLPGLGTCFILALRVSYVETR